MSRPQTLLLLPVVVAVLTGTVYAQHDAWRDAVRHIAAGRFDRADNELQQAPADDPETHFVRMMNSLAQQNVDEGVKHARAALDAGLPIERLAAGPRELLKPLYETRDYQSWLKDRPPSLLLHGPMLGSVSAGGASFWLRTKDAATVRIVVLDDESGARVSQSDPERTISESEFTAVVEVDGLKPSTTYRYEVRIDDDPVRVENARFRTFPAQGQAAQFSVGFGGGAGYVPMWESMWDTIVETKPVAFLMLGDNVYIDDPQHLVTQQYCYYRRQSRSEWRRLTASTAMYAIYDDHDFGTNDCVPGPEIDQPPWKREVWRTFRRNWVNPSYGGGERQPGCWCDFTIGDVHFILLDGRYYRSRQEMPSMLGPVQKAWLFETLKASKGTFKVLASPVPWSAGVKPGSRDPWDGYPEEREEIFSFVEENRIDGVFLIAADRHRTDLRVTERPNGYNLYEFESSRLTNRHTHGVVKTPGLIWGYNKTCSFGSIEFDTTARDPQVVFKAIDIDGRQIHEHAVRSSELRHEQ